MVYYVKYFNAYKEMDIIYEPLVDFITEIYVEQTNCCNKINK